MKKRWYAAGVVLLLLAGGLYGTLPLRSAPQESAETKIQAALEQRGEQPTKSEPAAPEMEAYESPIDFAALQEMNPDIYAWIQIPGTEVSYPVLQREGDDSYYLRRDSTGERDQRGCIFTESEFNGRDFTDLVTVVYGHYLKDGTMFGSLQPIYSTAEGMAERGEIVIYLPDREVHYEVFAAVPYSNRHILYYHDFSNPEVFQAFLDAIYSTRSISACTDGNARVGPEDRLLILSTCLRGDNRRRYLVLAKEAESAE